MSRTLAQSSHLHMPEFKKKWTVSTFPLMLPNCRLKFNTVKTALSQLRESLGVQKRMAAPNTLQELDYAISVKYNPKTGSTADSHD